MNNNYLSLITNRLILRPFTLSDVDLLCLLAGDRRISDMCLNIPYPYSPENGVSWISEHKDAFIEKKAVIFAVCQKDNGDLLGAIALELEKSDKRGEIGYWIGYPYQNKGYATEAVLAMLQYGFRTLSLNRITATTIAWNNVSARILDKTGFQKEGVLRNHVFKKGKFTDIVMWGILQDEFMDNVIN